MGRPRTRRERHRNRGPRTHSQRLDAQLELLGPARYDALGSNYGKCALAVLIRYADPTSILRLGPARLTRFLVRHSRGAWRDEQARTLLAAARESVEL